KMALAGAPTEVVQGVHADVLLVMLSSLEASRAAEYELWQDTVMGSRLEALTKPEVVPEPEPAPELAGEQAKPKPKRAPRKRKPKNEE
ncbi:MAG: hypothetical protein SNJ82_14340, partial [Gemmataceae bacterium]